MVKYTHYHAKHAYHGKRNGSQEGEEETKEGKTKVVECTSYGCIFDRDPIQVGESSKTDFLLLFEGKYRIVTRK